MEFGVLGALVFVALRRGVAGCAGWPPWRVALVAAALASAYAVSDEFHQSLVPLRQADALDLVVDALGALAFCAALALRESRTGDTAHP